MPSITETQTEFVLSSATKSVKNVSVLVPKPGPGDNILLKIAASDVCHSDLHLIQGNFVLISGGLVIDSYR